MAFLEVEGLTKTFGGLAALSEGRISVDEADRRLRILESRKD